VLDDDLPVVRFDQWHTKIIEVSERWLARREPAPAAVRSDDRRAPAVRGGSVRRYQPRHALSPAMRSILPRYSQVPWFTVTVALIVAIALGGLGFGYNIHQARASKQGSYLSIVQEQYDKANASTTPADGLTSVLAAESALRSAEKSGASDAVVLEWKGRLGTLRDSLQGIHRFVSVISAGALPKEIDGKSARLIQIGSALFVIAGSVYQIDASGTHLTNLLSPGSSAGGRTAGQIAEGAPDGSDLVVSDGKTLFRWSGEGWTSEALPAGPSGGWLSAIHGAYLGNYYLLDSSKQQIMKFAADKISSEPVGWIDSADRGTIANAVDMVLDGSIRVLLKDGSIETLFKGKAQSNTVVSFEPKVATEVGLSGGSGLTCLYVLERSDAATRLIRFNPETGARTQFQMAGEGQTEYDKAAAEAFETADSFAVNEAAGTVWFLSGGVLWVAMLGG